MGCHEKPLFEFKRLKYITAKAERSLCKRGFQEFYRERTKRPREVPGAFKKKGSLVDRDFSGHGGAIRRAASRVPGAAARSMVAAMEIISPCRGKHISLRRGLIREDAGRRPGVKVKRMGGRTREDDGIAHMGREGQEPPRPVASAGGGINETGG